MKTERRIKEMERVEDRRIEDEVQRRMRERVREREIERREQIKKRERDLEYSGLTSSGMKGGAEEEERGRGMTGSWCLG